MRGAMNSGMSAGMAAVSAESAHCPRMSPATLPRAQRTRLSATSCRTRRPRPAPSAVRIANSRMRVKARDSVRLATLTQAMKRRRATPAVSSRSCGRTSVTRSSCSGVTVIPQPTFLPARSFCSVAAMTSISARACSTVTPGLEPRHRGHPPSARLAEAGVDGEGQPEGRALRDVEATRHDADHEGRVAVDGDRAPHDARIGGVAAAPERVAQHRDRRRARRAVGGGQPAAEDGGHAEGLEETGGDDPHARADGVVGARDGGGAAPVAGQ